MKKLLSLILVFILSMSIVPTSIFAADATYAESGYAVHGISDGERILINDKTYRTISVIDYSKLNLSYSYDVSPADKCYFDVQNATNVSKVVYTLDGVERFTDSEAPYQWDMPFEKTGTHTLKVVVTNTSGTDFEFNYSFELVKGSVAEKKSNNFDADEGYTHYSPSTITTSVVNDPTYGNVLKSVGSGGTASISPVGAVAITSESLVRIEADVVRTSTDANIYFGAWNTDNYTTDVIPKCMLRMRSSSALFTDKQYHITMDIDVKNESFVGYVDGWEFVRYPNKEGGETTTTLEGISSWTKLAFSTYYTTYGAALIFDNVSIASYIPAVEPVDATYEESGYAVHGISDGERMLTNDKTSRTISVIDYSKLNTAYRAVDADYPTTKCFFDVQNATNVANVVYTLDGVERFTDTEAPYQWDMPFETAGEHALSVVVTTTDGKAYRYSYEFEVVTGTVSDTKSNKFEGETAYAGFYKNSSSDATASIVNDENYGNVLKMTAGYGKGGIVSPVETVAINSESLVRIEADVVREGVYAQLTFGLGKNHALSYDNQADKDYLFTMKSNAGAFSDKQYHITMDIDVKNESYVLYVDGWEFVRFPNKEAGTVTNIEGISGWTALTLVANYINYGNDVLFDNVSITSYEAAKDTPVDPTPSPEPEEDATYEESGYAVHGISDGERILTNDKAYRTISVIDYSKLNTSFRTENIESATSKCFFDVQDATNVSKVVYSLDGFERFTDTEAPYQWNMPFEKLGTHNLKVQVTTLCDKVYNFNYSFELVCGAEKETHSNDFEGETAYAGFYKNNSNQDTTASIYNDATYGNVLKLNASYQQGGDVSPVESVAIDSESLVRIEADVVREGDYAQLTFGLGKTHALTYGVGRDKDNLFTMKNSSGAFSNKQYHITMDIDVKNESYVLYVDGWEFVRFPNKEAGTATNVEGISDWTSLAFVANYLSYGNDVHFDNVSITSYGASANDVITNKNLMIYAVNNSDTENMKFTAIEAIYTMVGTAKKLVSATSLPVVLEPKGMFVKDYNNSTASTGEIKELFVWETLTSLVPVLLTE